MKKKRILCLGSGSILRMLRNKSRITLPEGKALFRTQEGLYFLLSLKDVPEKNKINHVEIEQLR